MIVLPDDVKFSSNPADVRRSFSKDFYQKLKDHMVIHENEHYMVINKPNGIISQGGMESEYMISTMMEELDKKLFIIQRLDK